MYHLLKVCLAEVFFVWFTKGDLTTLYTRSESLVYILEPINTEVCDTRLDAVVLCLTYPECDLISKNGTYCTFHTALNRNATFMTEATFTPISTATFVPCNCTLAEEWIKVGPFYLYETPEKYICYQGQKVCSSFDGIMAEFYSVDELNYALTYITGNVLVGANRMETEFRYYWNSTGTDVDTSLFINGQPDDWGNCVEIRRLQQGLDDTYKGVNLPVLCQKRI